MRFKLKFVFSAALNPLQTFRPSVLPASPPIMVRYTEEELKLLQAAEKLMTSKTPVTIVSHTEPVKYFPPVSSFPVPKKPTHTKVSKHEHRTTRYAMIKDRFRKADQYESMTEIRRNFHKLMMIRKRIGRKPDRIFKPVRSKMDTYWSADEMKVC